MRRERRWSSGQIHSLLCPRLSSRLSVISCFRLISQFPMFASYVRGLQWFSVCPFFSLSDELIFCVDGRPYLA